MQGRAIMTHISLEKLRLIAKEFTREQYGLELTIPIKQNNRLKTTLGRFCLTRQGEAYQIDISNKLLKYAHKQVAIGVVKHEAVHFALHFLEKPYRDGDLYFEEELKRLQLPSSTHKERSIAFVGKTYIFSCSHCQNVLKSTIKKVKAHYKQYVSSCCQESILYEWTEIGDGRLESKCLFLNI